MEACKNSDELAGDRLESFLDFVGRARGPIHPQMLAGLLAASQINEWDLARWISFDDGIYSRNRVALFPHAEVLVMCWKSGQLSPIHDHKGSACAIRVIRGATTEICYTQSNGGRLVPIGLERRAEGEVFHSYDLDIHQMGNMEEPGSDLVTLHCYSPPLTGMRLFGEDAAFFGGYPSLMAKATSRMKQKSAVNA